MPYKPNIVWEVPDKHQLLLSFPETSESTVSSPHPNAADIIYIFLDEAGNFDFSASGTNFFIMTSIVCKRPFVLERQINKLKFDFMEEGYPLELFHASSDRDTVKSAVYNAIASRRGSITAYSAVVDKRKLPNELKRDDILYSRVFELLTDEIYKNETDCNTKMVIIITDSLPQQAKKKNVEKPLKAFMKSKFQLNGIQYQLMHHQSCSNAYLQVADYLCWAVYRHYDKGHDWPIKIVSKCFKKIGQIRYVIE